MYIEIPKRRPVTVDRAPNRTTGGQRQFQFAHYRALANDNNNKSYNNNNNSDNNGNRKEVAPDDLGGSVECLLKLPTDQPLPLPQATNPRRQRMDVSKYLFVAPVMAFAMA